ncbi:carbohydrate esterase family 3 protein [Bombardia bombarda]|uniref:Carbohydrate esterase family 3 protein n=1 Tax=Bombardia bombarda TaxID=252184 RepID=A0AA39XMY8_9PEZI|nr:carbohydrate esterase family 3 protein [Bombardia bombarda]
MIFSIGSLFLALSSPMAHQGVAVSHAGLGLRATAPLGNGVPLRIMPLGASITYGQASTDGNGYRADLRAQLAPPTGGGGGGGGGNPVNMVGSVQHGTMKDNDVEGWPGYRIEQVHAKANLSVPRFKPNVVLVNAGTNDALQASNITTAGQRLERMLADVWAMSPRAAVVLSTLLINKNVAVEGRVVTINGQIRALVTKLQRAGRKVVLAEMHAGDGPQAGDMFDDTHPNDVGYRKMANIWFAALVTASDSGWLVAPEFVAGLPDDGGA